MGGCRKSQKNQTRPLAISKVAVKVRYDRPIKADGDADQDWATGASTVSVDVGVI
jgi:hypothetical protein